MSQILQGILPILEHNFFFNLKFKLHSVLSYLAILDPGDWDYRPQALEITRGCLSRDEESLTQNRHTYAFLHPLYTSCSGYLQC